MDLDAALATHFGFDAFRPGQRRIVEAVLSGREVLAVMPTGAGKSLCYQLPAAMLDGVTVVVSPLIALMKDQVDALAERGLPACFINSSLPQDAQRERIEGMLRGAWRLVYVAPERFRHRAFLDALSRTDLALLAIDEAHCISEWGHDFRPDYARLGEVRRRLAPPRIAAFTATATPEVRADIVRQLGFEAPSVEVHGFDRPNIHFSVEAVTGQRDKTERILHEVRALKRAEGEGASAIVYCSTRKNVEKVAAGLAERGVRCLGYHAGMAAEQRRLVQDRFMTEPGWVVVATNAFGMGVDKADVHLVVHHDLPGTTEAYYQEAGRAGRDGGPSKALLLWSGADVRVRETLIEMSTPDPGAVTGIWDRLRGRPGTILAGTVDDLARRVGVNAIAASAALRILEAAGHLSTERIDPDHDDRIRVRMLTPETASNDLEVDLDALARHLELERARLRRVVEYASREHCRRRALLEYFGDPDAPAAGRLCAGCDVCDRARVREHAEVFHDEELARTRCVAVLSLVSSHDGRFGRKRLALALAGSRARALERTRLEDHPAFGAFRETGADRATHVVDRLAARGLLDVSRGDYPVVRITPEGRHVLSGRAELPREVLLVAAPPRVVKVDPPIRRRGGAGAERVAAAGARPGPKADALASPEDAELFEALRALRLRLAREGGVPPYVVFHDAHLLELVRSRPRDREGFLAVKGLGPAKWEKWGEAVLAVVAGRREPGQ